MIGACLFVVFVVLMLFWLFGGGYLAYEGPAFDARRFGGNTLIPWVCVAILGWVVFNGVAVVVAR
jgi:uncharacterized membrane protein YozB (DUF420 family)